MEHETFFLSLAASGHTVAFDPSVTLVHQNSLRSDSYNAARQVESVYLQYMCRNFPRIAIWHLPYWHINCVAHTHNLVHHNTTLPVVPIDWNGSDDSSTVRFTPAADLLFFVIIPSASTHVAERDQLRGSWLRGIDAAKHDWDYGFFVGAGEGSYKSKTDYMLGDIVTLSNVPDEYTRLSLKVLAALRWVALEVTTAFVLKVDTDTWVAPEQLAGWLRVCHIANMPYP